MQGMGLLPLRTEFTPEKARTRVTGTFGALEGVFAALGGQSFEGYEIHMGETPSPAPIAELHDSVSGSTRPDGCCSGNVYGSYVHGILDAENVARTVIDALAIRKGVDPKTLGSVSNAVYKQRQYDILADTMRAHMDMKKIYEILEAGIE